MNKLLRRGISYLKPSSPSAWVMFWVGCVYLVFKYGTFLYFQYPSAPGGDLYNHYLFTQDLQQRGFAAFFSGYPKLFHLVVLIGTHLTGLPFLKFLLYLFPIVTVLMAYAWSAVAKKISGEATAALTFFILLFVSAQPHQTLGDGGFPSFIAAGILLPCLMIAASKASYERSLRTIAVTLFWLLCIVATHHITTFYTAVVLIIAYSFTPKKVPPYIAILSLIAIVIAIESPLGESARVLFTSLTIPLDGFPWYSLRGIDSSAALWKWTDYGVGISYFVWYVGLPSLFVVIFKARTPKQPGILAAMVYTLALVLVFGSRVSALEFPVRLARDAALPLSVATACGVVEAWKWFRTKPNLVFRIGQIAIIGGSVLLAWPHINDMLSRTFRYNDLMQYSNADDEAVQFVEGEPTGAVNQVLPSVVAANVTNVVLDNSEDPSTRIAANTKYLAGKTFIFYEVPTQAIDWQGDILREMNFHESAEYSDPLKTVHIYRKNDN